jgi:hypothetical protein
MLPYAIQPIGGITTLNAAKTVVPVDVPSRAFLHSLIVNQVGGSDAFTVEVYNNALAAAGSNNTDENGNTVPPGNYKVGGTFSGVSGVMEYFADKATGGFGLPFFNLDPPDTNKIANTRIIYVVITVGGGSGTKTFALSMGFAAEGF